MTGNRNLLSVIRHFSGGSCRWILLAAVFVSTVLISQTTALAQTKSLKLYYLHTGEKATITYKKNGQFLASGLKKINWHLRDWRRNEPTKMDPQLLDLIWEAYRQSGSKAYIHVISGYRSPASNNLLRKRGRGVAKNSQHTKGKALDFFLPDVKLSKMRAIGLKMGVGGVGYYPTSGSPFVHFDTGNVRHWPRMSRKELVRLFPKGNTMHVPADGKPLAHYQQAVAAYKRKKATGTLVPKTSKPVGGSLFARLTKRNNSADEEEGTGSAQTPRKVKTKTQFATSKPAPEPAAEPVPAEPEFASLPKRVPVPVVAPRGLQPDSGTAIIVAAAESDPALMREETAETAIAGLTVPVPAPRPGHENVPGAEGTLAAAQPVTELALVDPSPAPASPSRGTLVAALTPSEIEDLRSRVRSTIGATGTLPRPAPQAPIPAAAIPVPAPKPVPAPQSGSAEMKITSLEPAPKPETSTTDIGTPTITTASLETPQPAPELVSPIGIEPGVRTSGKLPIPAHNPANPVQVETPVETLDDPAGNSENGLTRLALANIPLPVPSPLALEEEQSAPITVASLDEPTPDPAVPAAKPAQRPSLQKRTISLDRYSAPRENSSSIGKFALAANTTIRELADVRAPAYGRNVIREVPKIILVQGFALQPFGPGQNMFSGKAVTAMKFERQRIN